LHVLITTDTVTQSWTYTRELVTGLATQGVQVTLVSFGEIPLPEQVSWVGFLDGVTYIPTAFCVDWMQDAEAQYIESSSFLAGLVLDWKPDVLHLGQFCYGDLRVEVPRMIFAHGDPGTRALAMGPRAQRATRSSRWYKERVRRGIDAADVVVATTDWMLRAVRECYGAPRRGVVIGPGRNAMFYNSRADKEDLVLSVGRMQDAAQQVALLTGLAQPLPVCIVYTGPMTPVRKNPIRADVRTTLGRAAVAIRGPQSDGQMRSLYTRASIYAATSCYEPLGLVTVEAALSRCAIIANDVPSYREMWGDAAYYFAANDAESLHRALRNLSDDPQLRASFAERAYLQARSSFTSKRMVDGYLALYRSLADSAPSTNLAA
jgi:glycogen(starch) synthase